tara:strand:- start:39 stop:326 length:288 start_codon:yes stop_codon:yes gene_type:complete
MLILYTQPRCGYCDILKEKLTALGHLFREVDITQDKKALALMKELSHNTVPQLYWGDIHVNDKDTLALTPEYLDKRINECKKLYWPWEDSGLESF